MREKEINKVRWKEVEVEGERDKESKMERGRS